MKKINTLLISLMLMFSFASPGIVLAASNNADAVCVGLELTGGKCGPEKPGETGVNSTIRLVINLLSLGVGIAAVIMIVIGGFKYIISSGDSSNIKSAKDTILYAIIGLFVVAMAQIIVKFVLVKLK